MLDRQRSAISWIDFLWLAFLAGLAVLPPVDEIHKQLILLAIAVFQFFEGSLIARFPRQGRSISIGIKIVLATLLLDHTGEIGINSSYYPIYYLPVITAAIYYGPLGTLLWTTLVSFAYCSLLVSVLEQYELTTEGATDLAIRILFFFIAAILVNRFATENRRQMQRYQELSETLEQTNRELRRVEAEIRRAERLAALGQLSAGLAHEIRNPLGVIKGSAEMLSQKLQGSNPLASELAGYISSEVNRLNSLVARFLDFARPSRLDLTAQQIPEIVDRALESARAQMPAAHVHAERRYPAKLPGAQVDAQLCEQVFVNLILNAFQAMDGTDGKLTISACSDSSGGKPGIAVQFEDTGPGVPPELREQIFNPFFTSKKDGVGLGLAIVAKIVDDHRGWIRLETDASLGAKFRVFLPLSPDS
jgi:C4-dicarboxylate-specific signal transduction histidine kinase